ALLLTVLAEADARDWTALPPDDRNYRDDLTGGVSGLRVAYSPTLGNAAVDPAVRKVTDAAAQTFAELGAHVEEAEPEVPDPLETFTALWYSGAANAMRHL